MPPVRVSRKDVKFTLMQRLLSTAVRRSHERRGAVEWDNFDDLVEDVNHHAESLSLPESIRGRPYIRLAAIQLIVQDALIELPHVVEEDVDMPTDSVALGDYADVDFDAMSVLTELSDFDSDPETESTLASSSELTSDCGSESDCNMEVESDEEERGELNESSALRLSQQFREKLLAADEEYRKSGRADALRRLPPNVREFDRIKHIAKCTVKKFPKAALIAKRKELELRQREATCMKMRKRKDDERKRRRKGKGKETEKDVGVEASVGVVESTPHRPAPAQDTPDIVITPAPHTMHYTLAPPSNGNVVFGDSTNITVSSDLVHFDDISDVSDTPEAVRNFFCSLGQQEAVGSGSFTHNGFLCDDANTSNSGSGVNANASTSFSAVGHAHPRFGLGVNSSPMFSPSPNVSLLSDDLLGETGSPLVTGQSFGAAWSPANTSGIITQTPMKQTRTSSRVGARGASGSKSNRGLARSKTWTPSRPSRLSLNSIICSPGTPGGSAFDDSNRSVHVTPDPARSTTAGIGPLGVSLASQARSSSTGEPIVKDLSTAPEAQPMQTPAPVEDVFGPFAVSTTGTADKTLVDSGHGVIGIGVAGPGPSSTLARTNGWVVAKGKDKARGVSFGFDHVRMSDHDRDRRRKEARNVASPCPVRKPVVAHARFGWGVDVDVDKMGIVGGDGGDDDEDSVNDSGYGDADGEGNGTRESLVVPNQPVDTNRDTSVDLHFLGHSFSQVQERYEAIFEEHAQCPALLASEKHKVAELEGKVGELEGELDAYANITRMVAERRSTRM